MSDIGASIFNSPSKSNDNFNAMAALPEIAGIRGGVVPKKTSNSTSPQPLWNSPSNHSRNNSPSNSVSLRTKYNQTPPSPSLKDELSSSSSGITPVIQEIHHHHILYHHNLNTINYQLSHYQIQMI